MVSATLLLVALVKGFDSRNSILDFRRSIDLLNNIIKCQLDEFTEEETQPTNLRQSPESKVRVNLRRLTWIRLTR